PTYAIPTLAPATARIAIRPSARPSALGQSFASRLFDSTLLGARIALSTVDITADTMASTNTSVATGLISAAASAGTVPTVPSTPSASAARPVVTGTMPNST